MLPIRYVWFAWSALFFAVWLVLFACRRRYRLLMWWSSVLAVPFGLSEPFFLMRYWHPPSLFNLSHTVHGDLETFLFCFSIGGTAAVGYHVATRQPLTIRLRTRQEAERLFLQLAALLAPVPAFGTALIATGGIIWAGLAGFLAGVLGRLWSRPDLAAKTLIGGLIFLAYYVLMLLLLLWVEPGYLGIAWNLHGPAAGRIGPLPATELLFGLGFGLYWSGLYEQLAWLFAGPALGRSAAGRD